MVWKGHSLLWSLTESLSLLTVHLRSFLEVCFTLVTSRQHELLMRSICRVGRFRYEMFHSEILKTSYLCPIPHVFLFFYTAVIWGQEIFYPNVHNLKVMNLARYLKMLKHNQRLSWLWQIWGVFLIWHEVKKMYFILIGLKCLKIRGKFM